jgi:flavin reductase (DIM6/NTAB) family NADH-FMN oxidoreductase RutF
MNSVSALPAGSRFAPVALAHASRLLNHGPTVMITSIDGTRRNVMSAAWSTPVEFVPPRIAVVIDKRTFTKSLIAASGTFGICVPNVSGAKMTRDVGVVSGRDQDKFATYGIDALTGPVLGVPVIESGCSAWLECRLIPEARTEESYDTCFCEVVSAAADPAIFRDGHWQFDGSHPALHTLHYLGGGNFVSVGNAFSVGPIE